MAQHGGKRPGSGRPKGGRNKRTAEVIEKAKQGGEMPLDFMLRVMRDEDQEFGLRCDMAKSAAPYLHARLQNTTLQGDEEGGPLKITITEFVEAIDT